VRIIAARSHAGGRQQVLGHMTLGARLTRATMRCILGVTFNVSRLKRSIDVGATSSTA
jgi:hypothetical protein